MARPGVDGEFDVSLGPPGHPPAAPGRYQRTNYLVAGLGPVEQGQYQWAVVTDPHQISLYVLARNAR